MESKNPQPEPRKRKLPSPVLVIVVAALAGAGVSRFRQATNTPESDASISVSAQSHSEESLVKPGSETFPINAESVSFQTSAGRSIVDGNSSRKPATEIAASIESGGEAPADGAPEPVAGNRNVDAVSDAAFSELMFGTWEDDYKGHRTLTLNSDGTGIMVVELNGFAATLFAEKLKFQEAWEVADGKVTMKATGGEPAGKVRLVLSLHGDSSTQRIVEVTDDRMILVEEPSGTRFEWRRVQLPDSP
jgi:hypothetical protein